MKWHGLLQKVEEISKNEFATSKVDRIDRESDHICNITENDSVAGMFALAMEASESLYT